jgi:hypothetical protein
MALATGTSTSFSDVARTCIGYYRSIPDKRPWALYCNSHFFTTWALTQCNGHLSCTHPCAKLVGGVNVQLQSRSPLLQLASLYTDLLP